MSEWWPYIWPFLAVIAGFSLSGALLGWAFEQTVRWVRDTWREDERPKRRRRRDHNA